MYEYKNIHYKAIFKQEDQKDTVEYKAKGKFYLKDKELKLHFVVDKHVIDISKENDSISLTHDQSTLKLNTEHMETTSYHLPYGNVQLKTKVLMFEASEENIKMRYELYDYKGLISTVYIFINLLPYVN